jgi:hypothetical protein
MDAEDILYEELERIGSGGEIKNPESIWRLLDLFPKLPTSYKLTLIEQVEKIARCFLHNPNLLMSASRGGSQDVLNNFITLALNSSDQVQIKILNFIELLVTARGVKKSNTQHVFQFLAHSKLTQSQLMASLQLLQILISQHKPPAPYSYFYFSGTGSGIEILNEKTGNYPFGKGFSACFWVRVEDICHDRPSRLFVFHSKGNGGHEGYFIRNKLFYRILGPEYSNPEVGSNGIFLHEFQPLTWTFIGVEHEKGKVRKSVLRVVVDGDEIMSPPVDFPVCKTQNPEFSVSAVCLDFTGQLACAMVFNDAVSTSCMKTIHSFYNCAPQGHESLRSLHRVIDKKLASSLYLFYHPMRVSEQIAYDGMNKSDGKLLGLSGFKHMGNLRMSYLGGICAFLPIVEKISEFPEFFHELTLEWFRLLVLCLKDRPENQIEACKMKFFKALAEILSKITPAGLKEPIIDLIEDLNNFIMPQLRDQLLLHLLWLPEFWSKSSDAVQSKLYKFIKVLYTKATKQVSKTVGVQKILEILLEFYPENELHVKEIVSIVEVILLGNGENIAYSVVHVVGALFGKTSNVVQAALLMVLKKVLNDRPGDIVGAPSSVFLKYFVEACGLEMLLVLLNSGNIEIRSVCLSLIDSVLSSSEKMSLFSNKSDIFNYISSVILPNQNPKLLSGSFKPLQLSLGSSFGDKPEEEEDFSKKFPSLKVPEPPRSFGFPSPKEDLGINPPPAPSSKKKISFSFPDAGKSGPTLVKKALELKTETKVTEKPKKGFSFDLIKEEDEPSLASLTERSRESEEEKREDFNLTLQNPKRNVKSFSQTRKKPPKFTEGLIIDTDAINNKYPTGGEHGSIVAEQTEDENLIKEVAKLAKDCVKYMRGELEKPSDFFLPVGNFPPQSCRGHRKMDFNTVAVKCQEIIEEVSLDMSSSSFFTSPRKKEEEKVYHAVLEMVLKRSIEGADILDDSDFIQSTAGLSILQDVVMRASSDLKHKVMQDLMMLTKWNTENAKILSKNSDWHYWLLDLLLETGESQDTAVVISDIGHRLHTIVMKQAILNDEDGWKYLRRTIYWLESKKNEEKPRGIVKNLLEKLSEILKSNSMGCRPCLESTFWKNLIATAFLIEEFLLYSDDFAINPDESSLLLTFVQLLDPIWPEVLFEGTRGDEEHLQLLRCIESKDQGGFKADIQILIFEPPGELKQRGWFIKTLVHLTCIALKTTKNISPWLSVIERLIKFILLVSESSKKQLSNSSVKVFTSCVIYSVGFLINLVYEESGNVQETLVRIFKYIFSIYVHSSRRYSQGIISNMIKKPFQSMNVCEEVVLALTETLGEEMELNNLANLMDSGFMALYDQVTDKQWQADVLDVFLPVQGQFENKSKARAIQQSREKVAEKLVKERDEQRKHLEETNLKIADILQEKSNEKVSEEENRKKNRESERNEQRKQRSHMWTKRKKIFSEWRGVWHVATEHKFEPFQIIDSEGARPLLKISSENYEYLKSHTTRVNPQLSFKAEILAQNSPTKELEEELDTLDEETNRNSLKLNEPKESLLIQVTVGIMQALTTKYGTLSLYASKKDQKLKFQLNDQLKDQFETKTELFEYIPSITKSGVKEWKLESLVNIIPHLFVMQHTAAEFFFDDGRTVLVQFQSSSDRYQFVSNIKKCRSSSFGKLSYFKAHNPGKILSESGYTEKWLNWQISNFEYLMFLNFVSGRSFHDLAQYPVFPWVLNDYVSETIDLNSRSPYRDLSRNMGCQGSAERTKYFKDRFSTFSHETSEPPFHFGSHYSNPGIVLSFLVRLFPYSEGAKELQGGRFDLPDRLFKSVKEAWFSCTDDISDVRELTPEFFFLPEFLVNRDKLDFGKTQQGERVNDVELPRWCKDHYDFIRIQKEALESEFVSEQLHKWIDLIFGYKQQGAEAESSINSFYYLTYENLVDLEKASDPALRRGIETQIVQFGKTPSQLFTKPHPSRKPLSKMLNGSLITNKDAQFKIYLPAHRKSLMRLPSYKNFYELPERAIVKTKMFKDKEIVAIRNNGNIVKFSWWSEPMGDSRTPFTCASNIEIQMISEHKSNVIECFDRSVEGLCAPVEIIQQGKVIIRGGYWDGRLGIKKTHSKEESICRWNHHSTITCVEVDDSEKYAITGGKDGDVFLWQVEGEHLHPRWNFIDHDDQVTSVTISSQLHLFASCSLDGTCNLYSLRKGRLVRVIHLPFAAPCAMVKLSTAQPAKVILFTAGQSMVFTYSVNGAELCRVQDKFKWVSSALVVKDLMRKDFLVYGTDTGDIVIRHAGTLELVRRIALTAAAPVLSLMLTSDLRFLLACCADGEMTVITDPSS